MNFTMMHGSTNVKFNYHFKSFLQQHVSAPKSRLQAEYKAVYIIQCHKMDEISFT